ncbi:MAG: EAL domain-containing protein [Planctomycetota bacterium]
MSKANRILLVDSHTESRARLRDCLEVENDVAEAASGSEALERALAYEPDLILIDVELDDLDGYEVCRQMRAIKPLASVKVILLAMNASMDERVVGYRAGADDFIVRPFGDIELLTKIGALLRMKRIEEASVLNRLLIDQLEATNSELSDQVALRERAEQKLRHDSLHDFLTKLPNRALLLDRIQRCLVRKRRETTFGFALLFLDLDDFKIVNDSLGHEAGDQLLIEVSRRLSETLRDQDSIIRIDDGTTARLGGDEFVMLLEGVYNEADVLVVEARLRRALNAPFELAGQTVRPNGSIGIAFGWQDYSNPADLLRDADIAMYNAKSEGKYRTSIFTPEMRERAVTRRRLEHDLQHAIAEEQLYLHYQPIISVSTGELHGFEALVRWDHPERGSISPAEFIPLAEETGLIIPLGEWVLHHACAQTADWHRRFPERAHLTISVNVSGCQLLSSPVHEVVDAALSASGLDPHALNLELTESVMIDHRCGEEYLGRFTAQKIGLHMDDFGTGYSSLSYLSRLPITAVKLDGSFVADMLTSVAGAVTVRSVLQMAHSRGIKVIAEGVEEPEQVAALRAFGCDLAQGYHFSRPVPAAQAERLLAARDAWLEAA